MDLRSIINSEATENAAPRQSQPLTPAQAPPPPPPLQTHSYREYSQSSVTPSSKYPSQDYGSPSQGPFNSPTAYQPGYQSRPPPQSAGLPPTQNDLRSPAGPYPAQSPYRHQSTSSAGGGQYPFPSANTPHSPVHAQSHPPSFQARDSYPANITQPQPQYSNPYRQASPTTRTTPPVGTPGSYPPTLQHQRSASSHSASTPTSAQGPNPYPPQYSHESPLSASSYAAQAQFPPPQHQRQQSQPGTPLGPPISTVRHPSAGQPQPTSPYQQRPPSNGSLQYPPRVSPAPIPAPSTRLSNTPGPHDTVPAATSEFSRRSQSERERSVSVSPKTRVSSQPRTESFSQPQPMPDVLNNKAMPPKRKFEEEEVSEPASIAPTSENHNVPVPVTSTTQPPPKKRKKRYTEVPIWAQSSIGRTHIKYPNGILLSKNAQPLSSNGGGMLGEAAPPAPTHSAHGGIKSEPNGSDHQSPSIVKKELPKSSSPPVEDGRIGAPEHCITGLQPMDEISKLVADWIFLTVVNRPDAGELASRKVAIEIEAKLGQLVDKETNDRIRLPVSSECILTDNGRIAFRSSMTEAQHKHLNEYLNGELKSAHLGNPNRNRKRIPIDYKHRREIDRFYELPPRARDTLPPAVKELLSPRQIVKVRVTTDLKGQMLAKIIKTRVANLDLHLPQQQLDCRISVNLEMDYVGDIEMLTATAVDVPRLPGRNKDRLSYKQLHYQVDLTQVTVADSASKAEKEHELEIEVNAQTVVQQGNLARSGQPKGYSDIIQGFIDNVRILARATPPA